MHKFRHTCRLCSSANLKQVLRLAPTALCDAYLQEPRHQDVYPLNLCLCFDCGFVQIDCVIDPEEIYRDYLFVTTSSSPLRKHFRSYVDDALNRVEKPNEATVVDIGSNEGTLLNEFQIKGCRVLGIEPAREIARTANQMGIRTIPEFFGSEIIPEILSQTGPADIVTVNNLFANVDNLEEFVTNIKKILKTAGLLVIESSYLKDMLDNLVFDFIYHEHLSYFSFTPLYLFFKKFEMNLFDARPVPTKGGSLRYFISNSQHPSEIPATASDWLKRERDGRLTEADTYKQFNDRIGKSRSDLIDVLQQYDKSQVVGYGASATSTTLIASFGLDRYLGFLVDDFKAKQDTFSPGVHLRVSDPKEIYTDAVEVVVILAWRYADEIIRRNEKFRGVFVIPLPTLRVVAQS